MESASKQGPGLTPEKRAFLRQLAQERQRRQIPRRKSDGPVPASFAQERLWFIDQLEPGSPVYNIPMVLRLAGKLDVEALEQSLNEIVRRHESLRTAFLSVDGKPLQALDAGEGLNKCCKRRVLAGPAFADSGFTAIRPEKDSGHNNFFVTGEN